MKKLCLILFLLFVATSAHARYVSVDFDASAGAEHYTFKWSTVSGGPYTDYEYDLWPEDGTIPLWASGTYNSGDVVYWRDNVWVANTTTNNAPINVYFNPSADWDGPYYPYFTATNTTGPLPVPDETIYAVVTATNASAEESAESAELVYYYLEQDGYPTPEQIAIFLQEDVSGWVALSPNTPTYVDANTFTIVGNDLATYTQGQKLKIANNGDVYSTIRESRYNGSITTVDLLSSVLTSGSITAVSRSRWSSTATATMRYRKAGEATWTTGHELYHIVASATEPGWAWTIWDLDQGSNYAVEVTVSDVGEDDVIYTKLMSTSSLPALTTAEPDTIIPAGSNTAYIENVISTANDGDIIEFEDGTYTVDDLDIVGSTGVYDNQITLRGETRTGVILSDSTGYVIDIYNRGNIIIENLTIQGSGVDSGFSNSSIGIWAAVVSEKENIVIRYCNFEGVDQGIVLQTVAKKMLVYENNMAGNNTWTQDSWVMNYNSGNTYPEGWYVGDGGNTYVSSQSVPTATDPSDNPSYWTYYGAGLNYPNTVPDMDANESSMWGDEGIMITGQGNVAFNNTLTGFGDSLNLGRNTGTHVSNHAYRNKITMGGDDAVEMDKGHRNLSFYDNHVTNSSTFVSMQDVNNGPLFAFRNVGINIAQPKIYKTNGANSGLFLFNNTVVNTANPDTVVSGSNNSVMLQFNDGLTGNTVFHNNLMMRKNHTATNTLTFASAVSPMDFTYNSWYPDGQFKWEHLDGTKSSLADAYANLNATANVFSSDKRHTGDVIEIAQPFETAINLPPNTRAEVTTFYTPILAAEAGSKNSGLVVTGITDGYSGDLPDRGAIISGRAVPTFGATYVYGSGDPDPDPVGGG